VWYQTSSYNFHTCYLTPTHRKTTTSTIITCITERTQPWDQPQVIYWPYFVSRQVIISKRKKKVKQTVDMRFEVFTVMTIQVVVFWVATLSSDAVGYQRFGKPCSFRLQGEDGGQKTTTWKNMDDKTLAGGTNYFRDIFCQGCFTVRSHRAARRSILGLSLIPQPLAWGPSSWAKCWGVKLPAQKSWWSIFEKYQCESLWKEWTRLWLRR